MSAGRYQTVAGLAEEPFSQASGGKNHTIDAGGFTVYDTQSSTLRPLLWADYQAELAQAAALVSSYGGGGYAGRGFVNVVFDVPLETPPPPRRDVCTCGGQKFGGGTCASWCDSSAARAQHSVGGEP